MRSLITNCWLETEMSPERKREKEARTGHEFQVEEYGTLDKPVVIKGKELNGLVGILAASSFTLSPPATDMSKVLLTLRICLTSKPAQIN